MFRVGDRVEIKYPRKWNEAWKDKIGTVVSLDMIHAYEGWSAVQIKLDEPYVWPHNGYVDNYYGAKPEELVHTVVQKPKPIPPKRKKWWQWGS